MSSVKQWIKNSYVRTRFYGGTSGQEPENVVVFFMKSGYHQPHPGLVDRLKTIVGLYYVAKCNDMDFVFSHDDSFPLEKYLKPARVNWNREDDISRSRKNTMLMQHDPRAAVPRLQKGIQHHCYYYEGKNILRENGVDNWQQVWSDLYQELFETTDRLKAILDKNCPKDDYVAVHFRFVNTLDRFEKHYDSELSDEEKAGLIEDSLAALERIKSREHGRVLVFSDSVRFLKEAGKSGFDTLDFSDVGHVSENSSEAVWDKTFLDLYSIAGARVVYSVRGGKLYNSAFAEYASMIGGKDFKIENI